jgi:hypothetical protein
MPGLGRSATRGLATLVAVTVALVASLLIGGQLNSAGATGTAQATTDRGVVAKNANGKMASKIVGKASDGSKVTGTFTPLKAVKKNGQSAMKGVIEGVVTHPNGTKERFTALRTIPVKKINGQLLESRNAAAGVAACDILNLVLGPLHLDILGLVIDLNRVVLNIVAVAGAGNLLGNLLCAVAGLLDGGPLGGLLAQLTDLLNQILAALNLGI